MARSLAERDRAREAIRATVRLDGARLKALTANGMVAALVAAALAPLATGPGAFVALLGATGSGYITEFLKGVIGRLRAHNGEGLGSESELQQELERALLACLEAQDERAAGLRGDAAALLESVQGVQAALDAASDEARAALTDAFTELSGQFNEFRWMNAETLTAIQRNQRYHIDITSDMRVKMNLLVGQQTAAVSPAQEPAQDGEVCPYMGLAAFQAQDAQWFFGRGRLVSDLVVRLSEAPFLAVVGPSGSGKSSVLRAGLLSKVWGGELPWAQVWTTIVMTPGAHPVEELAVRLGVECKLAAESLLGDWRARPGWLRLAVRQALADAPEGARVLLLVDQFEEVFTLCADEVERRGFILALAGLAGEANSQAIVVLGIRADFYARCAQYPELVAAVQDRQVLVGPMTVEESREAITGPAARAGLMLQPGLVETVLADLGEEPGSLPLLSHALFTMWQQRDGDTLTLQDYRKAGGIQQAIGRTADAVFAGLDPAQQMIAQDVFLRLTALGQGTEDTRRRASRAELVDGRDADMVQVVLDRLAWARLVALDGDSAQVAHEALIREWPLLRGWLTEDREGLRTHRRLTEAADEWEALGRDPGALYRGGRLAGAREWAEGHKQRLNDSERAFLAASCNREQDELQTARRRNRRLRALAGVLAVLLVLVATSSAVQARRQRAVAIARQLAVQASANRDQTSSLLLSLESLRVAPTDEGRASLLQGLLEPPHARAILNGHTELVYEVAFSLDGTRIASAAADNTVRLWDAATGTAIGQPLTGHTGYVDGVVFSPDGKTLASAGADGTVRLWDAAAGTPIGQPLTGHTGWVWEVAFSPDGTRIAAADDDGIQLWDVATGTPIDRLSVGEPSADYGVAFSPDGTTLASAHSDGTVRLWDTATGAPVGEPLNGHFGIIGGVAFSPDGTMLASASGDKTVRLWDAATGAPIGQPLFGHTDAVRDVAFSPDSMKIASSSDDGTVRLWDAATGTPIGLPLDGHGFAAFGVAFSPDGTTLASGSGQTVQLWDTPISVPIDQPLAGHTESVWGVGISPDGTTLASSSLDKTVRLWDATTGAPIGQPLSGHTDLIMGWAFSPDGDRIATASWDRTVRLWDAATGAPIGQPLTGHTDRVWAVAFSPDSATLASTSADKTVRLWDVATGAPIGQPLSGHTDQVLGVEFSPDGTTLASASWDRTVRLWDAATGTPIGRPLVGHTDRVWAVVFSPDGTRIASYSVDDKTVRLWDAVSGEPLGQPLTGHTGLITRPPKFSPDGMRIATTSQDGTVRLWDATSGGPVGQPLTGHTGPVHDVEFSPDGKTLASAGADGTVRLWDAASGTPIDPPLTGHTGSVEGVRFIRDGTKLATAGNDRTVRLWPITVDAWIEHACTLAGRNLTQDEWDRFVGLDRPYVRACADFPSGAGAPTDAPAAAYRLH